MSTSCSGYAPVIQNVEDGTGPVQADATLVEEVDMEAPPLPTPHSDDCQEAQCKVPAAVPPAASTLPVGTGQCRDESATKEAATAPEEAAASAEAGTAIPEEEPTAGNVATIDSMCHNCLRIVDSLA